MKAIFIKILSKGALLLMALGFLWGVASCNDPLEGKTYKTSDELMMDEFMSNPDNQLTDFLKIVDKANYRGMLHAYGTYTCFAPTNEAVQSYLLSKSKTIESLSQAEAADFVSYHIVADTLSTASFVQGRLDVVNLQKQFLLTHFIADPTGIYYLIDRKARILHANLREGNGIIHIVNSVLSRPDKTLGQAIEALSDNYSILKGLIKDTGFDKILNDSSVKYTFVLQNDSIFKSLGIETRAALLQRLRSNTPEISNDDTLLLRFVQYHCVTNRQYLRDLVNASSETTCAPKEVFALTLAKDSLIANRFQIGQLNEPGIIMDRFGRNTDVTCSNGVLQEVLGQLEIKRRKPYRVYWDMADQPEMRALKGFRKAGTSAVFKPGELSEMTWAGSNSPYVTYACSSFNYSDVKNTQYAYQDHLEFRIGTTVVKWMDIKTPLLIAGNYKVWICWRRIGNAGTATMRTIFKQDGQSDQILPSVFDMASYMTIYKNDGTKQTSDIYTSECNMDDDRMVQSGFKVYTAKYITTVNESAYLGTIRVNATGRHTIRFEALQAGSVENYDMIQFIPEDENQVWPMVAPDGSLVNKGTKYWNIYPYQQAPDTTTVVTTP